MSELDSTPPHPQGQIAQGTSWAIARLTNRHQHGRAAIVLVAAAMVAVIGLIDFQAGPHFSLDFVYLVPIALVVAWLGLPAGCALSAVCVAVRIWGDLANGPYLHPGIAYWNRGVDLSMFLIFAAVLDALIKLHRELGSRVEARTQSLQRTIADRDELQKQLFDLSRRERSAIGRDLHDGLGQQLTATAMATKLLSEHLKQRGDTGAKEAETVLSLIQDAIARTRQIAHGLLLAAVEPDRLLIELEELADALSRERVASCRFIAAGVPLGIDMATASHLYYIAREAAYNAQRHAQATRIEIRLESTATAIVLRVADNGRGLPPPGAQPSGMGLRIMRHRSELMGAAFSFDRTPDGGTTVCCRLPLPPRGAPVLPAAEPKP